MKVRLTEDAYAHGFALALPAQVSVPRLPGRGRPRKYMSMARPTGVGHAITTHEIPTEGRDELARCRGEALRMRHGYLRGELSRPATQRQIDVLAAFVAAGGSVPEAAELVGIRPSTVKRHLVDMRAWSGLTTEQLIYVGRAAGWLVAASLEPAA